MYIISVLCIVLCALCLPFLVFGEDMCYCTEIKSGCNFENKYKHSTLINAENVALGKWAAVTSTLDRSNATYGLYADLQGCLANNGNRATEYVPFDIALPGRASCIHTDPLDAFPQWGVYLGRNYTIMEVVIYPRSSHKSRMEAVTVEVDKKICFKVERVSDVIIGKCESFTRGLFVTVSRSVPKSTLSPFNHTLNICEVEIWTCKSGYYSPDCSLACEGCIDGCDVRDGKCLDQSDCKDGYYEIPLCTKKCGHCNTLMCDILNGSCPSGCKLGWKGDMCTEEEGDCNDGYYEIPLCTKKCGHCNTTKCDRLNGICPSGCKEGWKGDMCTEEDGDCNDGYYEIPLCTKKCGHCNTPKCDKLNGSCPSGCKEGWKGDMCTEEEDCKDGYYEIPLCTKKCGHCITPKCDRSNGRCPSGCEEGWKGDMCTEEGVVVAASSEISMSNLGLILGIIGGLALLAGLLFILAIRRRVDEEEAVTLEPDVEGQQDKEGKIPPAMKKENYQEKIREKGSKQGGYASWKESDVDKEEPDENVSDAV